MHIPVSDEMLKTKASWFHQQLCSQPNCHFTASNGWLSCFKTRKGVRRLKISGEKLSANVDAINPFIKELETLCTANNIHIDNIYNADESALWTKTLPQKTNVHSAEKNAPGRKVNKERLTFMACANVTGTNKMQLQIIGKSKRPRCFKKQKPQGIHYYNSANAWQTGTIFKHWFTNCFIPKVAHILFFSSFFFILFLFFFFFLLIFGIRLTSDLNNF